MKATLGIEYIGERYDADMLLWARRLDDAFGGQFGRSIIGGPARPRKPWVAEISDRHEQLGLQRRFLPANWQRKRANGPHSRGVELWFVLESGRVYEVNEPVSWRRWDRYFCAVDDAGNVQRLSKKEVEQWLNARSASTS
jgi:hypothetical protein